MPETPRKSHLSTALGVYDRAPRQPVTGYEAAAALLSLAWLGLTLALGLVPAPDAAGYVVAVLPLGLIWITALALRHARETQAELDRLRAVVDALRQTHLLQRQTRAAGGGPATRTTAAASPAPEPAAAGDAAIPATDGAVAEQGALALDPPAPPPVPLPADDFLRALNFPESAADVDGFAALSRARRNRVAAQLLQAAEDVLTLLSQEGVYMDDLRPDTVRPEIWRQFAQGQRGPAVSALGSVRDPDTLDPVSARMKADPIFRDVAHHFLRLFDRMLANLEPVATDGELVELANTRTARAFILLSRVAGAFD
ncbi:hypothetical protein [Pukyongiella litopenaei]|uniref:Uncharacterized protein n=1 Tax=Pukyongiella litopenaei TaxID=2605946 RepID=A0A2S0MR75_9RHOB|nr:hypothetical protein [Pukyongiella litopenaei]AVO38388.1 hypothetical protein C6Y53_12285 [Pukyongiella litopenaei]